ncbi:DMT family transporter, partial [Actinotalea ferrariae]|uniref:DMT family transporter n=1 Tax=Actinotalea ferrariae TaxID=1386098 RepID=UPI001C8C3280
APLGRAAGAGLGSPIRGAVRPGRAAPLMVLGAAVLWGTTGTAQAIGGVHDPVVVGAARLAVGGAALVVVALVTGAGPALARCLRRPLLGWTLLAAVATAVYQAAFFSAVAGTGVATGTVVALGTAPVATGVCGALLFRERLTRRWLAATALAVAGCVCLVLLGTGAAASGSGAGALTVRPAGVGLAVLAGVCYALYTSGAKALLDADVPVVPAMAVTLGLGAVLLAPVLVTRGAELAGGRSLLLVAWLGLVTTGAAYLFFARGLRRLPAGTVGTLSLAEPLTAAALGLLALGERPPVGAVVGGVSLLAGLVLAAVRPTRAERDGQPEPVAPGPPAEWTEHDEQVEAVHAVAPAGRSEPVEPVGRAEATGAVGRRGAVDRAERSEPGEPVGRAKATGAVARRDAEERAERSEPVEPVGRAEVTRAVGRRGAVDRAERTRTVGRVEQPGTSDSVGRSEAAEPVAG